MATSAATFAKIWRRTLAALAVLTLAACAQVNRAPVEDRTRISLDSSSAQTVPASGGVAAPPASGAENAGRPGYYTVRAGDTLIRIGLETGQSWKDLARWNNLENPDIIEVGQVVRVIPPVGEQVASFVPNVPSAAGVEVTPVATRAVEPVASAPVASTPPPAASPPAKPPAASGGKSNFVWPAQGSLLAGFGQANNNGVDIGGTAGDPVVATAAGKVVYSGSDLRGYGNLIILQHNETYLSIYAHNQKLLVKEDQIIKQGQKIAEMGSSDSDRVKLHFELRRQGKPVNPVPLLPAR